MYKNKRISKFRTLFCAAMLLSMAASSIFAVDSETSSQSSGQSAEQQENASPPASQSDQKKVRLIRTISWIVTLSYFGEAIGKIALKSIVKYIVSNDPVTYRKLLRPLPPSTSGMLRMLAKKMNVVAIGSLTDKHPNDSPAGAISFGSWGHISIDNSFLKLSDAEQKFVLAHELAHIMHKDGDMNQRFSATLILLYGLSVCTQVYRQKWDSKLLRYPELGLLAHMFLTNALAKKHEYAADEAAVKLINSLKGGLIFLNRSIPLKHNSIPMLRLIDCLIGGLAGGGVASFALQENDKLTARQRKAIKVLSTIAGVFACYKIGAFSGYLVNLFGTHPSDQARINALRRINLR